MNVENDQVVKQLNQISQKRLALALPHPDDEINAALLVLLARQMGWHVEANCLTRGELGKNWLPVDGRSLAAIRTQEFRDAMNVLGIKTAHILDYPDGHLHHVNHWQQDLWQRLDQLQPGLIVSYGPGGLTGHPDHIAVGQEVVKYARERGDIHVWWIESAPGIAKAFRHQDVVLNPGEVLSVRLNGPYIEQKQSVIEAHRSQNLPQVLGDQSLRDSLAKHPEERFVIADLSLKYDWHHYTFKI